MSAHTTTAQAPFRFLDLPNELRLMVYELLPVARIHRKIEDFPTLVVLWSPTTVLLTCREVMDEAKSIVNGVVRDYRHARKTCSFCEADDCDYMVRMLIEYTPQGPRHLDKIIQLIKSVLECRECLTSSADAPEHGTPTNGAPQSAKNKKSAPFITEWIWQAARLPTASMHPRVEDSFAIAVTVPASSWHTIEKTGELFTEPTTSQFLADTRAAIPLKLVAYVQIYFVLTPAMTSNHEHLYPIKELSISESFPYTLVKIRGDFMSIDEREHVWNEDEWL